METASSLALVTTATWAWSRGVHQSLGLFCQARLLGNYRQALALGSMSLAAWLLFNVFHERPRANNNFHFRERVLRVFSTEFLRRAKGKSTGIYKPGNWQWLTLTICNYNQNPRKNLLRCRTKKLKIFSKSAENGEFSHRIEVLFKSTSRSRHFEEPRICILCL